MVTISAFKVCILTNSKKCFQIFKGRFGKLDSKVCLDIRMHFPLRNIKDIKFARWQMPT